MDRVWVADIFNLSNIITISKQRYTSNKRKDQQSRPKIHRTCSSQLRFERLSWLHYEKSVGCPDRFLQGIVAGDLVLKELGWLKLLSLSASILRTPHILKQFVYSQMSLFSELWLGARQATDILQCIFIIPNVNCIIITLIDSVSGPLWVALNLVLVWSRGMGTRARPNIKLSITVQRNRLDLNNHDCITNNIPLIIINSPSSHPWQ